MVPPVLKDSEPVSIIIPAYNEEGGIHETVRTVRTVLEEAGIPHEILVVDDGSGDNTRSLAKKTGATVIRHRRNQGYGASLKTGIGLAKNDIIVIIDADGTYPAGYLPEIVQKMKDADMVVGARIGQNVNVPLIRRPAKWFLRHLAGYLTGESIPDLNSGLRAFRREVALQYFGILPDKFSFTTTITVAMLCDKYDVVFIPIDYRKRTGKSKIVPRDFFSFTTLVLRLSMLFNPLKVFIPMAFACLIIGFGKMALDIVVAAESIQGWFPATLFARAVISNTSLIFLIAGLQILLIGMVADGIIRKLGGRAKGKLRSYSIDTTEEEKDSMGRS
jgi:glycosyltransferase involved in cell wall biosynthesis